MRSSQRQHLGRRTSGVTSKPLPMAASPKDRMYVGMLAGCMLVLAAWFAAALLYALWLAGSVFFG
jgi:hypothetical protein